jgi:hypothetical protein
MKLIKINKKQVRQIAHWSIFIIAALAMALKIADVSAYETLKVLKDNPECAPYSTLVTHGYLFENIF